MTRRCARCAQTYPADLEHFHAKTRYPDGTVRTFQSYCHACAVDINRERNGYRKRPPVKTKAQRLYQKRRRYRARVDRLHHLGARLVREDGGYRVYWREVSGRRHQRKFDAYRYAVSFVAILEADRRHELAEWRAGIRLKEKLRRERAGAKAYPPRRQWKDGRVIAGAYTPAAGNHPDEHLDAAPFLEFLNTSFPKWTYEEIAAVMQLEPRRLREWVDNGRASLDAVDRALTVGLGRPDLLNALYPVEVAA